MLVMSTLGKSIYGTVKEMENFLLNLYEKISSQMPQSKGHGNGSGTRSQAEQKFHFQGSKECPEEARRHVLGSRISWVCHHHLHLGWLAHYEMCRIKKKPTKQTKQSTTNPIGKQPPLD